MSARGIEVVRLLADGACHSGEALADALGITRAGVWKAVHAANAELGVGIEAVRGRGYRLPAPLELLDASAIRSRLDPASRSRLAMLEVLEAVDSTSSRLLGRARAGREAAGGAAGGEVCLAERQSAGRGRRGRTWVSPFGRNLYLSVLWRYPLAPAELGGLSLAAGVAVAEALTALGADGLALKWPNDVHWRRHKLAGLLLEVGGETEGPSHVVVGVGINLRLLASEAAAIDQPWVDLETVCGGCAPGRNAAAAATIAALLDALHDYGTHGLAPFLPAWRRLDAYLGEAVELIAGTQRIRGVHAGIDDRGNLVLDGATGQRRFAAGEVSLRDGGAP